MRVLVTGATGFCGRHLVRALLSRGDDVRALVRRDPSVLPAGVEAAPGDVRDEKAVKAAVDGVDAVVHLAASLPVAGHDDPEVDAVNVGGSTCVAAACRAAGARLLHVSSVHALRGGPRDGTVTERSALAVDGLLAYDRSKALAEAAVLAEVERGLDARVINPVGVLGPDDARPSPVGTLLLQLARGELPGMVSGGFWWVDVRDVALAALRALERPERGARYLLSAEYLAIPAIARFVHEAGGARPPLLVAPLWLAGVTVPFAMGWARLTGRRPIYSHDAITTLHGHQQLDDGWTRAALGLAPRPVRESVSDAITSFRDAGLL